VPDVAVVNHGAIEAHLPAASSAAPPIGCHKVVMPPSAYRVYSPGCIVSRVLSFGGAPGRDLREKGEARLRPGSVNFTDIDLREVRRAHARVASGTPSAGARGRR
jgi:hypothetical protein